jgi:hypothetical protein
VVDCNPGVFAPWISRRIPTSVDMLEPDNPLLNAMERLPIAPCVQLHSIIGVAKNGCISGPGDGVVTLTSATHPGACSEKMINAKHEELHEAATTLIEIERILQEQLCHFDQQKGLPAYNATDIYSVAPR